MRIKLFCYVVVLILGCAMYVSAQDNGVFFYSGGKKVYGNLSKQWVAIKLKSEKNITEVEQRAGIFTAERSPLPKELSLFTQEGISFIKKENFPNVMENILMSLRDDPDVEAVGIPLYLPTTDVPLILTDEFVVKFKADVTQSQIEQMNSENHVELVKKSPHVDKKMVLRVTDTSGKDALEMANYYYESGLTEFSHPNFIVHVEERFVPNDALYPDQWHLNNTGQRGGTVDADIDAEEAWDITRGDSGIIIAVIDSGVQIQHEDLQPNQFTNSGEIPGNGIDDDGNTYIDDVHGWNFYNGTGDTNRGHASRHGTSVAGVAAGRGNNAIGISGSCPNCTILPIARGSTFNDHADSFDYAVSMGAHIITNSWGYTVGTPATDVVENAINDAATNGRGGLGCVVTFAMTNTNVDNCDPASLDISALDNVIAISRSDDRDVLDNGGFGDCMELLSPTRGAGRPGLTTTDQTGADGYSAGDYAPNFGGTSGATPQVAGIAALMLTLDSSLTKDEVRTVLIETADKIDAENADYDISGFSDTHGYGRVNAYNAVCAVTNCPPSAEADGPYSAECGGATTDIPLDGTGSSDPNGDPLTYSWTTDCPGGSFDDSTSPTPNLTLDTLETCFIQCNVTLTVIDGSGASDSASSTVRIRDELPPEITSCPAEVTVECNESTDPDNTGSATATDVCNPSVDIDFSDASVPGTCPEESVITRTWIATDSCSNSSSCVQTINIVDTTAPDIDCPADITIECDESRDPGNTGFATALDNCDSAPAITFSDIVTPSPVCPEEETITRTWTATDCAGNSASCVQTIMVDDSIPPVISCNAPATITPPDAPISFTATATDNCAGDPSVEIIGYDCFKFTKKGKRIDKTESCIVGVNGDTVTIVDSGGVNDNITWTVRSNDNCGNVSESTCSVLVVLPERP